MAEEPDIAQELQEELDLESPRTIRDVVIQTHAIVQQILVRLDKMDARMDRIEDRTDKRFLWLTGSVLTTWITLMVTILVKI